MCRAFVQLLAFQFKILQILFKSRDDLILEIIELRQQLATYRTEQEKPKNINDINRLYLIALKESWSKWQDALVIVKPETVIDWQNRRFKSYWKKISYKNKRAGRPSLHYEIRKLIEKMATENSTWGAPRIYSEILMLGYTERDVSQRTVSRYLRKIDYNNPSTRKKRQQWRTFLENHREHIMAMDFFTVPTISFKILYMFFIIDHARIKIVHFNVTMNPTAEWVKQQFREFFPFESKPKYLIFDRGSIFSSEVKNLLRNVFGYRAKGNRFQGSVAEWNR